MTPGFREFLCGVFGKVCRNWHIDAFEEPFKMMLVFDAENNEISIYSRAEEVKLCML